MSKCKSCGEKPQKSRAFPSAVVEINNPEQLVLLRKVVIPASMPEETNPPVIGRYKNVILQYEDTNHLYIYSSDGIPTPIEANIPQEVLDKIDQLEIDVDLLETDLANETTAREAADTTLQNNITAEATARANADTALNTAITSEVTARQEADTNLQNQITQEAQARAAADTAINGAITAEASTRQTADAGLQSQIDAITASSDVKDIVGTKAELNNYDTSTLGNNDLIKVLQDESENNATTYYRWNATTQQFTLIGEEGPYYTKSQADTLLNAKQNTLTAGSNVQITGDTISATDTTYTAGNGLNLTGTEFSADTTVLATQTDLAGKQNTLTAGTGIDITNDVISATGGSGVTELTTADFNWPTNSPDGIALWLLASGMYQISSPGATMTLYHYSNSGRGSSDVYGDGTTFVVVENRQGGNTTKNIYINNYWYNDWANTGVLNTGNYFDTGAMLLTRNSVINNLTSTSASVPLSANQGKVLADRIGDLSTLTTTDKTSAVAAINEIAAGGGGPTVVQTTGTSTTDVMSQNAVTSMVFADPGPSSDSMSRRKIRLGPNTSVAANQGTAIGAGATITGAQSIAITGGNNSMTISGRSAIGIGSGEVTADGAISLGLFAPTNSTQGKIEVGSMATWAGYNNSNYRLLTGLYDPQSDHDAATKGYVDNSLLGKQDALTAGSGISIAEESGALVISSTGGGASAFTTNEWNALWA